MSEQQFNGAVEQVAAGDIKNFVEAPKVEKEYLSSAQRQALNALVAEISVECGVEARILWREVVHARVGVERIGEIQKEKFLEAQDALLCYRDNHRKQANIKLLVSRITSETKAKNIYGERDAHCLRQFGEKQLNAMSSEQLRQVLVFVEDYQVPQVQAPSGSAFAVASIRGVVLQYPWHFAGVFVLGSVIGKIF